MKITTLCILIVAAAYLIGWEQIPTNDRGSIRHYGADISTLHTGNQPGQTYFHASRETVMGDSTRWMVHATSPAEQIETLMIGPLTIGEFIPGCSNEDTVKFHFELAEAFLADRIDSTNDFDSDPLAVSPTIYVPYAGAISGGYSERSFFSSSGRPQGNGWDDFVEAVNGLQTGRAFVVRMVNESGSGVVIRDYNDLLGVPTLSYSTNAAHEPDFLDVGDTRLTYLTSAQAASFHGMLLRGHWRREWGTNWRLTIQGTRNDSVLVARALTIPFQENQLSGSFIIGVEPALLAQYPRLVWLASNPLPTYEGYVICRGDTLTAYYRP